MIFKLLRIAALGMLLPRVLPGQAPDSLADAYLHAVEEGRYAEALELAPAAPLQAELDSLRLLFPSDSSFRRALHLPTDLDLNRASPGRVLGQLLEEQTTLASSTQLLRPQAGTMCPPLSYAVVPACGKSLPCAG